MHTLQPLREAAGMTKAELGRRVGCTGQMIGQIEAGLSPGVVLAAKIASVLHVQVAEVFPELAGDVEVVVRSTNPGA